MPNSCKCILDRMVFKGAMTLKKRNKILRNITRRSAKNEMENSTRCSERMEISSR